jgi:hypothetical protein
MRKTQHLMTRRSARLWFLGTVIAMVAVTVGAAFAASAFAPHQVTQQASAFTSSFVDVTGFKPSTAGLNATILSAGPTTCTTPGTATSPINISSSVVSYYNATSATGKCITSAFTENFTIQTAAPGVAGTWAFTFYVNSTSIPTPHSFSFTTVYSTSSTPTTALTLTIYLEFGNWLPAGGVQAISLLVTPA